jgi:hypothetical protein
MVLLFIGCLLDSNLPAAGWNDGEYGVAGWNDGGTVAADHATAIDG